MCEHEWEAALPRGVWRACGGENTHCRAAPCIANTREMGFFVLVGVTVLLHDAPSGSGGGESSVAQFHPSLRGKGAESVILLCRPGRNIPC